MAEQLEKLRVEMERPEKRKWLKQENKTKEVTLLPPFLKGCRVGCATGEVGEEMEALVRKKHRGRKNKWVSPGD